MWYTINKRRTWNTIFDELFICLLVHKIIFIAVYTEKFAKEFAVKTLRKRRKMVIVWIFVGILGIACLFCFVMAGIGIAGKIKSRPSAETREKDREIKALDKKNDKLFARWKELSDSIIANVKEQGRIAEKRSEISKLASKESKRIAQKQNEWTAAQGQTLGENTDPDFAAVIRLSAKRNTTDDSAAFLDAVNRCRQKALPCMQEYFVMEEQIEEWRAVTDADAGQRSWKNAECGRLHSEYAALEQKRQLLKNEEKKLNKEQQEIEKQRKTIEGKQTEAEKQRDVVAFKDKHPKKSEELLQKSVGEQRMLMQGLLSQAENNLQNILPQQRESLKESLGEDEIAAWGQNNTNYYHIVRDKDKIVLCRSSFFVLRMRLDMVEKVKKALKSDDDDAFRAAFVQYWDRLEALAKGSPQENTLTVLPLDALLYYEITEKPDPLYSRPPQQQSMLGTALTEAVWGTAAATNRAMQANAPVKTVREATLYFSYECGAEPLRINEKDVDKLKRMFPEKNK